MKKRRTTNFSSSSKRELYGVFSNTLYKSYCRFMLNFLLSMWGGFSFLAASLNAMENSEEEYLRKAHSPSPPFAKEQEEVNELKLSPTLLYARRGSELQQTRENSFSRHFVNSIFKTSPDLVVLISEEGKLLKTNEGWKKILGWEPEEVLSLPYINLLHLKDQERLQNIIKGHPISSEQIYLKNVWKLRNKDNSYRKIEWVHIPIEYSPGETLEDGKAILLVGKDITEREKEKKQQKRKIKSLYKSLEQRNKLLQALSDIQSVYIEKERLPQKGSREEEIFPAHYKPLKLILKTFLLLTESEFGFIGELFFDSNGHPFLQQVFTGQNKPEINERIKRIRDISEKKGKKLGNFNNILKSVVETKKPLLINDLKTYPYLTGIPEDHLQINTLLGIPFTFDNDLLGLVALANNPQGYSNELVQWIEPITNLTGRMIHEFKMEYWSQEAKDQQYARSLAEESNKAKSIFLAHMSHEIRTPLSAILGLLEIMDKDTSRSEIEENINRIRQMSSSLLDIVNDILDVSKIEAGQLPFEEVEFKPVVLVNEVVCFRS